MVPGGVPPVVVLPWPCSTDSTLSNASRRVSKDAVEVEGFDTVPETAADDAGGVPPASVAILTC